MNILRYHISQVRSLIKLAAKTEKNEKIKSLVFNLKNIISFGKESI